MAKVAVERKHAKGDWQGIRAVALEKIPRDIEDIEVPRDVWILNDVDWGVKRTRYREVIRKLGETLNMNWAYGVEFFEVDSKQLGTDTFDDGEDEQSRQQLLEEFKVDKDRLRALHGNAVLSRYPIRSAKLIPFSVGYDWFKESKIRPLEKAKRKAAVLIGEDLMREVRRGQRSMLIVDLDVPDAPDHAVTVVSTHLENRTKPKVRRKQMQELLKEVHDIPHPVIVAGDLNTTGGDSTPTSIENMLYKRYGSLDFWTTKGIQWTTGVGLVYTGASDSGQLLSAASSTASIQRQRIFRAHPQIWSADCLPRSNNPGLRTDTLSIFVAFLTGRSTGDQDAGRFQRARKRWIRSHLRSRADLGESSSGKVQARLDLRKV